MLCSPACYLWLELRGLHDVVFAAERAGPVPCGNRSAPVTNWTNYDTIYTERYLGLPAENADGYRLSSAVTYAANLRAKLMETTTEFFERTLKARD